MIKEKYSHNKLNDDECNIIYNEIANAYSIIYYSKDELKKMSCLKLYEKEKFIGCVVYKNCSTFIDLKIFLIIGEYQNKGYGNKLFKCFLKYFKAKSVYASTRNNNMIKLFEKYGFKRTRLLCTNIIYILSEIKKVFSIFRMFYYIKKRKLSSDNFHYYKRKA